MANLTLINHGHIPHYDIKYERQLTQQAFG